MLGLGLDTPMRSREQAAGCATFLRDSWSFTAILPPNIPIRVSVRVSVRVRVRVGVSVRFRVKVRFRVSVRVRVRDPVT